MKKILFLSALFLFVSFAVFSQEDAAAQSASMVENAVFTERDWRLFTVGFSMGTSFSAPYYSLTAHAIFAPFKNYFLQVGCDLGFTSNEPEADYYSLYPFGHLAYFRYFSRRNGFYAGAGGGIMLARYYFPDETLSYNVPAFDVIAGLSLLDIVDITYTLRTNFKRVSNKVSFGYTYRLTK